MPGVDVIHAGTAYGSSGEVVSTGGRVLNVTATGDGLGEARRRAYAAVDLLGLDGAQVRRDIAAAAAGRIDR